MRSRVGIAVRRSNRSGGSDARSGDQEDDDNHSTTTRIPASSVLGGAVVVSPSPKRHTSPPQLNRSLSPPRVHRRNGLYMREQGQQGSIRHWLCSGIASSRANKSCLSKCFYCCSFIIATILLLLLCTELSVLDLPITIEMTRSKVDYPLVVRYYEFETSGGGAKNLYQRKSLRKSSSKSKSTRVSNTSSRLHFFPKRPLTKQEQRKIRSSGVDFGDLTELKLLYQPPLSSTENERNANNAEFHRTIMIPRNYYVDADPIPTERDDDFDPYYAFDDDYERSTYKSYDDETLSKTNRCRRASWHRLHHPNCNTLHEMNPTVRVPKHISDGEYRSVFRYTHEYVTKDNDLLQQNNDTVIWKQILLGEYNFTYDVYEFVRMDALVSERLTASPRIVDVYGHCGVSILSEFCRRGNLEPLLVPTGGYTTQAKLDEMQTTDVKPLNDLSPKTKLLLGLEMAKAVAELHGYADGVMVHDDMQVGQYLYSDEGTIKLNDFNRAEVMLYDEQLNQYCKYRNGEGHGICRAPEEYKDEPLDESIDVYSFGNILYTLLTGLWPFYGQEGGHVSKIKKSIIQGNRPFIDPRYRRRSYPEGMLVHVMEQCWLHEPEKRPSIFQVIAMLEEGAKNIEREAKERELDSRK